MTARPEWLPDRPDAPTPARWTVSGAAPISQATRGEHARATIESANHPALIRVALIESRYGVANVAETSRSHDLPEWSVYAANRAHALAIYAQTFEEPVPSLSPRVVCDITGPSLQDAITALASLPKKSQRAAFLRNRKALHPKQHNALVSARNAIEGHNKRSARLLTDLDIYANDETNRMTYAAHHAAYLAEKLARIAERHEQREALREARGHAEPEVVESENGARWYPLIVERMNLTERHTGLMGRKRRPAPTGKALRYPDRITSDPARRVFQTKTAGIGAVVLVDMSGSMRLTLDQVAEITRAAHGATVIGYSAGYHQNERMEPNAWIMAQHNRRTTERPSPCGGNGADLPALEYAQTHRKYGAPLIWISDGQVTGHDDIQTPEHLAAVAEFVTSHRVTQVETAEDAIALLRRAQRGGRVKPEIREPLASHARAQRLRRQSRASARGLVDSIGR